MSSQKMTREKQPTQDGEGMARGSEEIQKHPEESEGINRSPGGPSENLKWRWVLESGTSWILRGFRLKTG